MEPDEDIAPLASWDSAYDHFARWLGGPRADGCDPVLLQPALVRLRDGGALEGNRAIIREALKSGELVLAGEGGDVAELPSSDAPFIIHWPAAEPMEIEARFGAALEVLQLGRPICQPLTVRSLPRSGSSATGAEARPAPIVAVIDDGIGFLNRRFCRPGTPARTRLHAVWLQAFRTAHTAAGNPGYVQTGRVLRRAEIDAWLAQGAALDEAAVYREINRALLEPGAHRSAEMSFSHGTHVLDTAAGADPSSGDPVADWPLLAVQLPPEAVDNTAGTQLEPMLVQAVSWCLRQAESLGGDAPVVIVAAFATFAGPKDGTKAVEALIRQDVDAWRGRTGREARVIFSFGNARLTRQAARLEVSGEPAGFDWRLMPEDFTASYLELRPDNGSDVTRLSVRVTPPGGATQVLGPIPPNTSRPIRDRHGQTVGRFYHLGVRTTAPGVTTKAHAVLALSPSAEDGPRPTAPHGRWQIALAAASGGPIPLRAEVQRDDTPGGYRQKGRQSYLDRSDAHQWEQESGGWTGLAAAGPITRAGTHSSFVTSGSPALLGVAAARASDASATRYSAEGSPWTIPGPDFAALSDRGTASPGLVAAGTFSGSARMLDGTSVAAARAARALATRFDAQGAGLPGPAEISDLLTAWGVPTTSPAQRVGAGLVAGPPVEGHAYAL